MPRPWLALIAVIAAVPILEWFTPSVPFVPQMPISDYAAGLVVLVAVWALVDARPLAGLAAYALVATAGTMLSIVHFEPGLIGSWMLEGWPLLPAAAGFLVLPLAVWRMHRQSLL